MLAVAKKGSHPFNPWPYKQNRPRVRGEYKSNQTPGLERKRRFSTFGGSSSVKRRLPFTAEGVDRRLSPEERLLVKLVAQAICGAIKVVHFDSVLFSDRQDYRWLFHKGSAPFTFEQVGSYLDLTVSDVKALVFNRDRALKWFKSNSQGYLSK